MHEKYREFGGPDGGDGGKGGNVIARVDESLNTLYYYKTHRNMVAANGGTGRGRKKRGAAAEDLILKVPRGTIICDEATGIQIADLSDVAEAIVAKGGNGGFGNAHFVSSTRQTPRVAELGEPGEEKNITLELKMIADVGLVGLPNVGKSTLLSVISAARPKIANYEFTTIIPNLGVVGEGTFGIERGFIVADIPGLIEGASKGKGLGTDFLRHIERTKVLVHVLDATHDDLKNDYLAIRNELKSYEVDLTDKPEVVIVNKTDVIPAEDLNQKVAKVQSVIKDKVIIISAVAHKNLTELLHEIEHRLEKVKKAESKVAPKKETQKVFTIEDVVGQDLFQVEKKKNHYRVTGNKIERFAVRTDISNPFAIQRLKDILKKMGIERELKRQGAKPGDKIKIKDKFIEF